MIVFDLACGAGHVFEAWFGSSEDYGRQRDRGLVSCPICGTDDVDKAVMAPRLGLKGNQRAAPGRETASQSPILDAVDPARIKAMIATLAHAQAEVLESSQWVGPRLADEARAIHLGEADARAIHGQATPDEARALLDEGIPIAPLPFPVRPPETDN